MSNNSAGQIISGQFGELLIRQKSKENLELGELLVATHPEGYTIFQVYNVLYGSQLDGKSVELISGMSLEGFGNSLELIEPELRNYMMAQVKPLLTLTNGKLQTPKSLPTYFSQVRKIEKNDLAIFAQNKNPLYVGKIRSGSKELDVPVFIDGKEVFKHHILVPATTGRGKSNLVKSLCWDALAKDYCSLLILDPHDEYHGKAHAGLKDHPESSKKLKYYTPNPSDSGIRLRINVKDLKPKHFIGAVDFSDAQNQLITSVHRKYGDGWIVEALRGSKEMDRNNGGQYDVTTLHVVQRRFEQLLDMHADEEGHIMSEGIFSADETGATTLSDIVSSLEKGTSVIVDTSTLHGQKELLVNSMLAHAIFDHYKHLRFEGTLDTRPVVSIILEEAPRFLAKDVVGNHNVFESIAREGRKFQVGLLAITQIPSVIPMEILANINTKIILGIEMAPERRAVIDSAAQDLSKDERTIASLDVGEAVITSNFTKFAMPIKVPYFEDTVAQSKKNQHATKFSGIRM